MAYNTAHSKETIMNGIENPNQEEAIQDEADAWAELFNTNDQKEGMKAFIEKRKATFADQ